jgi:catechol 2,3-dioxygenase-like lactoylglutathione lyase family enzyme
VGVFRDPQLNIYATDVDVSLRFYRDLLGFAETFRTRQYGVPAHVELRLGELTLGLADIAAVPDTHGIEVGPSGLPRAEVVLWVTDDVDAAVAELEARGVPVLSKPHDFIETLRAAWVADPDGNPVQRVTRR